MRRQSRQRNPARLEQPRPPVAKLDWTTVSNKDGDEGPSKDYDWEVVPDDDD